MRKIKPLLNQLTTTWDKKISNEEKGVLLKINKPCSEYELKVFMEKKYHDQKVIKQKIIKRLGGRFINHSRKTIRRK